MAISFLVDRNGNITDCCNLLKKNLTKIKLYQVHLPRDEI